MQIVIDIDDDMYKSVIDNDAYVLGDVDWILLENAIANGTPLPEHHGRLIDADALTEKAPEIQEYLDVLAPTIIEADKEIDMTDIELVIKIPYFIYTEIRNITNTGIIEHNAKTLYNAIYHGTPLPKEHGRIIDYGYVVDAIDDWINAGEYGYTNATDYLRNRVNDVPTIIEGSDVV